MLRIRLCLSRLRPDSARIRPSLGEFERARPDLGRAETLVDQHRIGKASPHEPLSHQVSSESACAFLTNHRQGKTCTGSKHRISQASAGCQGPSLGDAVRVPLPLRRPNPTHKAKVLSGMGQARTQLLSRCAVECPGTVLLWQRLWTSPRSCAKYPGAWQRRPRAPRPGTRSARCFGSGAQILLPELWAGSCAQRGEAHCEDATQHHAETECFSKRFRIGPSRKRRAVHLHRQSMSQKRTTMATRWPSRATPRLGMAGLLRPPILAGHGGVEAARRDAADLRHDDRRGHEPLSPGASLGLAPSTRANKRDHIHHLIRPCMNSGLICRRRGAQNCRLASALR